jgi:hypothetical protein
MFGASINVNTTQQQPQSRRTQFTHINSITITNNNTILALNYTSKKHRNPTIEHWLPTCFIVLTKEVWQMLPYSHWNKLDNPIEYCKHTFGGPSLMGTLFLHTKQSITPTQQSLTCSLANGCSWNPWNFHHPIDHWPIYVMHYLWKKKYAMERIRSTLQKVNHHLLLGILPFKTNLQKNYTHTHTHKTRVDT